MPTDIFERIKSYVYWRRLYKDDGYFSSMFHSVSEEFEAIEAAFDGVLQNCFISQAEMWGLGYWEREVSLPPNTDLSFEDRKARILGAGRIGSRNATAANIKESLNFWHNGNITLIEDYANYRVYVSLADIHGVPNNIDEFSLAIRRLIATTSEIVTDFNWWTWFEQDAAAETWAALDAHAYTWAVHDVRG